jgi:hypothetical protein
VRGVAGPSDQPISPLVLDEYFAAGDARFLAALKSFFEPKKLASIADRWKKDHRPWAREQIFLYLDEPLDCAGHETVVKRLFKWAEEQNDDELMGAFAVAFDRLVRRVRATRYHYDWRTRASWEEERLVARRDVLPHVRGAGPQPPGRYGINPATGERIYIPPRPPRKGEKPKPSKLLFSYHTRYYLRRRVWRYFRRMGHRKPARYCPAVATMLRRYRDADLATGEALLDSWSFLHACLRKSDVLEFDASKAKLRDGRSLSEMSASPEFEKLWAKADAAKTLLELLRLAPSRAARVWSIQLLRRHHVENLARTLAPAEILALLDHADEEVQQFGVELLEKSPALPNLDVPTWLKLLETRNLGALETIARLMAQHVRPERLSVEQMVQIATAQPVPVARMGLKFLQSRPIDSPGFVDALPGLANARSAGVAAEITTWAMSILGTPERYKAEPVSRFFDSLLQRAREAAWTWLATANSPGANDSALWSRLIETPYDDVRFQVVGELERRSNLPGASVDQVMIIWTAVLLNIHRGGRAKLTALRQISRSIADDPARAEPLIPVLAVAIRSVRMPEVRTGLSAIVVAVEAHPPLADAVAKYLPEMQLSAEAAV